MNILFGNKLASLKATLVQNFELHVTGVESRATSKTKNQQLIWKKKLKDTASEDTLFGTGKGIIFQINSPIEQYWGQILVSASGREN